jgi:hypothetical protein
MEFKQGDRVTNGEWEGTFDRYVNDIGICDCIIFTDAHPEYEYAYFSQKLKLIDDYTG